MKKAAQKILFQTIGIIGLVLVAFYFCFQFLPLQSELQHEFIAWANGYREQVQANAPQTYNLTIKLTSLRADAPLNLTIESNKAGQAGSKFLHLIELIETTDLFSVANPRSTGNAVLRLQVDTGTKTFEGLISQNVLDSDVRVQTLVKLIQFMGTNSPHPAGKK